MTCAQWSKQDKNKNLIVLPNNEQNALKYYTYSKSQLLTSVFLPNYPENQFNEQINLKKATRGYSVNAI